MPATDTVRVRVPAKVNLHLGVGALRADGFHELVTVFHAVDLADEVRVSPASRLRLRLTGEGARTLPAGPGNIAWRAAALLADHAGASPDVLVEIDKAIPVAGGLAGGSADAAATLLACAALWQTGTSTADLMRLGAQLGSDVPFLLLGETALAHGRGERLTPVATGGTFHWVLAVADYGVSTAAAYQELDRQRGTDGFGWSHRPDALLDAVHSGDARRLAQALTNDLAPATLALAPGLQRTLDAGCRLGALAGIVSGSGPTIAFLCADGPQAADVAARLVQAGVCRIAPVARGPVAGAHVMA